VLVSNGVAFAVTGRVAAEVCAHARLDHPPQLQAVVLSGPFDDQFVKLQVGLSESIRVTGVGGLAHLRD